MTLSASDVLKIARIALEKHPSEELVRGPLRAALCKKECWEADDRELATRLLAAGSEADLIEAYVRRVPQGEREAWDRQLGDIVLTHPELAEEDPKLLDLLSHVLENRGEMATALRTLQKLVGATADGQQKTKLILRMVRLLPQTGDAKTVTEMVAALKPVCLGHAELCEALNGLCTQCRIPAEEAVEILGRWEAYVGEGGGKASAAAVMDARRALLNVYLHEKQLDGVCAVLQHCAKLENIPLGVDVEDMVDSVIGLHRESVHVLGKSARLLHGGAEFCLKWHRYTESLEYIVAFREAEGDAETTGDLLDKLIAGIRAVGEKQFLQVYLRAYLQLAKLVYETNVEDAEAALKEVRPYFFQVLSTGETRRLADAEECDCADEVRALRLLELRSLEALSERRPDDVEVLEDLALMAYSLRDWERARSAYGRLIKIHQGRPDATRAVHALLHHYFWCHYCLGWAHREQMLIALDSFIWEHRHSKDMNLDVLREYCAIGFHELAVSDRPMPEDRARNYRRRARRYYDALMGRPEALTDRPYIHELRDMLDSSVRGISPFAYLSSRYAGRVPYEIPLDEVDWGPSAEESSVIRGEPLPTKSGFGEIIKARRTVGGRAEYRAIKLLKASIPGENMDDVRRDFALETEIMRDLKH
jgi:tetratricopeptide (TPR) repeat protein